jgi:dimethylglycine dehydrogenase
LKLQKYSAALYRKLAASAENPINYHLTGSVRLAHGRNRMDEFHHVKSMAKANGLEYEILSPSDLKDRYPLIETHDLKGALWDPLDGDIDPSQLTQAQAMAVAKLMPTPARLCVDMTALARHQEGQAVTTQGNVEQCEAAFPKDRQATPQDIELIQAKLEGWAETASS